MQIQHNPRQDIRRLCFVFFGEIDELILELIWKCKGPKQPQTLLKKSSYENSGCLSQALFSWSCTTQSVLMPRDRWYQLGGQDTVQKQSPHVQGQLIFNKRGRRIQQRQEDLFNKWGQNYWISYREKKIHLNPHLTTTPN